MALLLRSVASIAPSVDYVSGFVGLGYKVKKSLDLFFLNFLAIFFYCCVCKNILLLSDFYTFNSLIYVVLVLFFLCLIGLE